MSNLTTVRKEGNKRYVYRLRYFIARKIKDKYTQKSCVFVVVIFFKDKNYMSYGTESIHIQWQEQRCTSPLNLQLSLAFFLRK